MRKIKIVADSAANVMALPHTPFAAAPLKVITADTEFVDDTALDVPAMVRYFDTYKGTSKTSCPNPSDWLDAFGDADDVFCVTITSGLSGSYSAACAAKEMYEAEAEGARVCVIDTLSAGPEMQLIVEKLEELIRAGRPYEAICEEITAYKQNTGLFFILESLKNFAANGRVSPAVAKIVGLLGIRVVGKASDKGTLEPLNKCRGEARGLDALLTHLKDGGLSAGKVCIAHCANEPTAELLRDRIMAQFPQAQVRVTACRGLCSYYAEKGGLLVGFERC